MKRVGVYIDYSNVYSGARDAFMLDSAQGYRGNVNPVDLAKHLAFNSPDGSPRRDTHRLHFTKVFRGAPDPQRDPRGALMEAKRAYRWERLGADVFRHTLDYGQGDPVEKGVDVRLAMTLSADAMKGDLDVAILASADKDYRYALIQVRDLGTVELEVATWQAIPGGRSVGRITLQPERPLEAEIPCHLLGRHEFGRLEDKIDYRTQPAPPGWRGRTDA